MAHRAGRHFLQIPGPSNSPDRILHALAKPTLDHRGPEFGELGREVLSGIKRIFQTESPVVIYPASGTGAWEAALVNALSPGDKVLMVETGQFASLWREMAERLGLKPEFIEGDWRQGVIPDQVEQKLRADTKHEYKAICVVHNETSTGATSRIHEVRQAIDAAGHTGLFMVDTISGLASMDYRHDEWGADVAISGSQKGLMLPPGISFNALSTRAMEAKSNSGYMTSYWDWSAMVSMNETGYFPYTPSTNLLYGLKEAIDMLEEEGLANVFDRHARLAEAARRCVQAWGLEIQCQEERDLSNVLTGVRLPDGHDADALRAVILDRFNMSLGNGLGKIKGRVFRIGHLGDFNESMLMGTLSNIEMGLGLAGVPHDKGGVDAAMAYLTGNAGPA